MKIMDGIKGGSVGWFCFHIALAIVGVWAGEFGFRDVVCIIPYLSESFSTASLTDMIENVILIGAPVVAGFYTGMSDESSIWRVIGISTLSLVIALTGTIIWAVIVECFNFFMEDLLEAGLFLCFSAGFFSACYTPVSIIIAIFDR